MRFKLILLFITMMILGCGTGTSLGESLLATPDEVVLQEEAEGSDLDLALLDPLAAPVTVYEPAGAKTGAGSRFPALDSPRIVLAAEATWLADSDLVLGVEVNGEARAYPVKQAAYHHIINDSIAGEPYLVTF